MLLPLLLLYHTATSTSQSSNSLLNNLENGSDLNGVAGVMVASPTGLWLGASSLQLVTRDFDGNDYQDDDYEYKEELEEGVDSGGLDPEVEGEVKILILSFFQICNCGKSDLESAQDAVRIVGGKEAPKNSHPWQAESS